MYSCSATSNLLTETFCLFPQLDESKLTPETDTSEKSTKIDFEDGQANTSVDSSGAGNDISGFSAEQRTVENEIDKDHKCIESEHSSPLQNTHGRTDKEENADQSVKQELPKLLKDNSADDSKCTVEIGDGSNVVIKNYENSLSDNSDSSKMEALTENKPRRMLPTPFADPGKGQSVDKVSRRCFILGMDVNIPN